MNEEKEEFVPQEDLESDVHPQEQERAEPVVVDEAPEEEPQSNEAVSPSDVDSLAHLVNACGADPVLLSQSDVDALVTGGHLNRNQMRMIKGRKKVVAVHPEWVTKLG